MKLTALFRDFLIQNKVKQKFEKNFLIRHPEFKREDGRFDWSNNKYATYILSKFRKETTHPLTIDCLLGMSCPELTFYWANTDDGDEFWYKIHVLWHNYLIKLGYDCDCTLQRLPDIEKGKTEI